MCDNHTMILGRHLQMKRQEKKEPLFRRVPQEMVSAWEKKNLTGKFISSLDKASKRIDTLLWRGRVCFIITILMLLISVPLLVVLLGSPRQASITICLSLLVSAGLMLGVRYIEWRSSCDVEELQGVINLFDSHLKAIKSDGDEEYEVWDISSRLEHLIGSARWVLYNQDIRIPSARRDELVSSEELRGMLNSHHYEKGHIKDCCDKLSNFGDYFNVPTLKSLYDMARDSMDKHIETMQAVYGTTAGKTSGSRS